MASVGFYPALVLDVLVLVGWGTGVAVWAARWPDTSVGVDSWLTRIRGWERAGRSWDRVAVRRWKGRLPDAASLFGGRRKQVGGRREAAWLALAAETRRAERVHWLTLLALPVQAAIRGGWLLVMMAGMAAVLNGPCIVAQRHNRGRLLALVAWRRGSAPAARAAGAGGPR